MSVVVPHGRQHAEGATTSATQTSCDTARRVAHEVITLAVRLHGRKRGFAAAAVALRRSERWVHGFHYHDEGAAPVEDEAMAALMSMRRQRAQQLRAELNQLEHDDLADQMVARACASGGVCG